MKQPNHKLGDLVDRQIKHWQKSFGELKEAETRPTITISRQPGSKGRFIARKLAEDLGYEFYAGKLINDVAKNAKLSSIVVKNLDEQAPSLLKEIISFFDNKEVLAADQYFRHLVEMIGAIGKVGNAVILGRGANFILSPKSSLRVRIIEPMDSRIQNVMMSFGVSEKEARFAIDKTESERREFVKHYFHHELDEHLNYDMILNAGKLDIDRCVEILKSAID